MNVNKYDLSIFSLLKQFQVEVSFLTPESLSSQITPDLTWWT